MIIPAELAQAYISLESTLKALQHYCEPILQGVAHSVNGKTVGRIKPVESVFSKIEKDQLKKPFEEIDDLYAATIIVPNETQLTEVETLIENNFIIEQKKPARTGKPEEFTFDVPQYILRLQDDPSRDRGSVLTRLKFELQVKTEMQAAASTVSRELSYKTKRSSWRRHRLSSRIWAMVEMIDDLLGKLERDTDDASEDAEEQFTMFLKRNRIIGVLEEVLSPIQLPEDMRRLAITVEKYLSNTNLDMAKLEDVAMLRSILQKSDYKKFCEASVLAASNTVFIVLFLEGLLTGNSPDPYKLPGKHRYLITSEMMDLCPILKKVPQDRRVDLGVELFSDS